MSPHLVSIEDIVYPHILKRQIQSTIRSPSTGPPGEQTDHFVLEICYKHEKNEPKPLQNKLIDAEKIPIYISDIAFLKADDSFDYEATELPIRGITLQAGGKSLFLNQLFFSIYSTCFVLAALYHSCNALQTKWFNKE